VKIILALCKGMQVFFLYEGFRADKLLSLGDGFDPP
jgi:hypothetical protein